MKKIFCSLLFAGLVTIPNFASAASLVHREYDVFDAAVEVAKDAIKNDGTLDPAKISALVRPKQASNKVTIQFNLEYRSKSGWVELAYGGCHVGDLAAKQATIYAAVSCDFVPVSAAAAKGVPLYASLIVVYGPDSAQKKTSVVRARVVSSFKGSAYH